VERADITSYALVGFFLIVKHQCMVMKYLKRCRVDSYLLYILGKSLCEYVSLMHVQNLVVI
jgi:hypothetical protein